MQNLFWFGETAVSVDLQIQIIFFVCSKETVGEVLEVLVRIHVWSMELVGSGSTLRFVQTCVCGQLRL